MTRTPAQTSAEIHQLLTDLLNNPELDWCLSVRGPESPDALPRIAWHFIHGDIDAVRELAREMKDQLPVRGPDG